MPKPLLRSCFLFLATCMVGIFLADLGIQAEAGGKKHKNGSGSGNNNGQDRMPDKARWDWKLGDAINTNGKPRNKKDGSEGTFMGYANGNITHGSKHAQVGQWKFVNQTQIIAQFTAGPLSGGTADVKLANAARATWEGTLTRNNMKTPIQISIIKD